MSLKKQSGVFVNTNRHRRSTASHYLLDQIPGTHLIIGVVVVAFPGASYEHQIVTGNNESGSAETGLRLQVHRHQTLISTTENSDGGEKASYTNLGYMLKLRLC